MLRSIIKFSLDRKLLILLIVVAWIGVGFFSLSNISIGAVPDITNNQVQVITTSRNLATEEVEKFLTYPVEIEMANLPGVQEIRSISKFGLSVVTVVFDDNMGTYLPRQLIAEKIKSAQEKIPEGFGAPSMGPVSTGLGEIYQYVLDVKHGYEDNYSVQDLRTIQDWIVKRQLSGIPGVVEVNTWGGFLKTYEVSLDPIQLKALDISLSDVYEALKNNNGVAGGGYIEKSNEAYFIRADGLIDQLSEIGDIVVDIRDGIPIYIRDIAIVGFGSATRFGAITGNGEGEKVLGQVMMLKGASSRDVIKRVKNRVAEVQKTLPEGVFINPFLERSELIGRTTFTIAENLVLGSLIVIFVVIILLGNLRSGLIVASIIPLSLLFAITMMYVFGIDANLMSLGAIDFGIIIDGAVIIVEYVAFSFAKSSSHFMDHKVKDIQPLKDEITLESSTKMMNSAVFGQIIIIIVFIPILTLSGVEGKMFRPMALTFSFALLGAMILCFTYVPVMASLFIKPRKLAKKGFSYRLISTLQNLYQPILSFALNAKYLILLGGAALLLMAGFLFSRMGGEFIPTLDEGDFVIQPVLKTGMSLDKTVEMTTRIEKIIKNFPETKQVVTRIGAAEVPTDPMSMEESDIIITLIPKNQWTSANTKDQLANVFKEAITEEIPGIEIEFTQPIEMRFNELITGVRADLAIKIFGEDLKVLQEKADEIKSKIENIKGASDIVVEKTEGLPQMTVSYDRRKIAQYGMNVADLNEIISMGFAGKPAGVVFEGEKQFDLVVRYKEEQRNDISDLQFAQVDLPDGGQLPLSTFADINFSSGPAKISRDDTRRRIVVGVNVRGSDLQTVVDEIQKIISDQVRIPPGYEIQYGGQFENLQSASNRLLYVVPIALMLILVMLYFAFNSIKDALVIFSAIPLASVGGVFLLYFRGMPFSISAGVGFIALFGIAVLNGIVLIEHFKSLQANTTLELREVIIRGSNERLRPVLLTASAAALGFLPMAISTSAGAEVQRPLATVVIGGLFSATILTLVVLPILYFVFSKPQKFKNLNAFGIIIIMTIGPASLLSQQTFTSDDAVKIAFENNIALRVCALEIEKRKSDVGIADFIPNTEFYYSHDRANFGQNNIALQVLGVRQALRFPAVNRSQRTLLESQVKVAEGRLEIEKEILAKEVRLAFNNYAFQEALLDRYRILDSIYSEFRYKSDRKYEAGDSGYLEKITANSKSQAIKLNLEQVRKKRDLAIRELEKLMQREVIGNLKTSFNSLETRDLDLLIHPLKKYQEQIVRVAKAARTSEKNKLKPEFNIGLFNGVSGIETFRSYPGIEAGVSLPLNRKSYRASIRSAELAEDIENEKLKYIESDLHFSRQRLMEELSVHKVVVDQFLNSGKPLSKELISTAKISFKAGEIDFFRFVQVLEHAIEIEIDYLNALLLYNETVININHLID